MKKIAIFNHKGGVSKTTTSFIMGGIYNDGIVIWQAPTGEIYQTAPGSSAHKLCDSLSEFISENFDEN